MKHKKYVFYSFEKENTAMDIFGITLNQIGNYNLDTFSEELLQLLNEVTKSLELSSGRIRIIIKYC